MLKNAALIPAVVSDLESGRTVVLRLFGNSMLPFLHDGRDKALLRKAQTPKLGEPVLAEIAPGSYVLHRVIRIEGDCLTLLGDGNLRPEYCRIADVRASVVGFYRKGRTELDSTDGRKWKLYSRLWMALRPLRRYLLAVYRRLVLGMWKRE